MLFPDINVLVYAYNLDASQHSSCARWLETAMNGNAPVCFSWHTIMGMIRIVTTVKMMPKVLTARPKTTTKKYEPGSRIYSIQISKD